MKILLNYSPNHPKKMRKRGNIKFIIIHYTGMQSEIASINRLKNPKSNVSCHYLINRSGKVIKMVEDRYVAWHAGKSKWKNFVNLNNKSLGIELVNKGHQYGYQRFTLRQIKSLIQLCKILKRKYSIKKENILGHSDISPLRKDDPGEKFPWKKLSTYNLGKWYKEKKIKFDIDHKKTQILFFKNLQKLGFRYFSVYRRRISDKRVIKAFQQHFLPANVNGKIDQKTLKISCFLIN
tara:strand:- start:27 stop:734 length:708 start_codon:yes stop_codon:yes gene_type:complete